ncbi:MAG: glycosyltransferase family 4 protein [Pseudomonadota bacterium]
MKVLLVSPFLPNPPTNGAKARIFAVIDVLRKKGHEVLFAYTGIDGADPERGRELMERCTDGFYDLTDPEFERAEPDAHGHLIDGWVSEKQIETFRSVHAAVDPDVTLVNYIFHTVFLEGISSIKVIDLHDRLARAEQYEAINQEPSFFFTSEERELSALKRADAALCIQDNERSYFEQSGTPVFTFGHVLPRQYVSRRYSKLNSIGYIGAYNIFNIHAITEFLEAYAPLAEKFPDVRIKVGGMICGGIDDYPHVDKVGRVQSLREFYANVDLAVNPTIAGTGLKIKSVEALSYGVPIISTRTGSDGLPIKTPMHALPDIESVVEAIATVKSAEFKELTKLSNLAKVAHTEYALSQEASIDQFLDFVRALTKGEPSRSAEYAASRTLPTVEPARLSGRVLHVLNPFEAPESSDNFVAQPITFQSMLDAKACATGYVDVDVLNVALGDEPFVEHAVFTDKARVTRTSKSLLPDYPRSLPLLSDILDAAYQRADSEWVVYTNADIALTPMFYRRIAEYAADGYDAIVINRRTIGKEISAVDQIARAYGQIGQKHPGFDCFVFKRELIEKFELFDTLVGVHLIGRMLIWNLLRHAKKVLIEKEEHLTFHIGDDVPSKDISQAGVIAHNFQQAEKFWRGVEAQGDVQSIRLAAEDARVADALKFGVGQLVTPETLTSENDETSRTLMIHGHFRCGSTFLFRQLRKQPGNYCFYEPLHEDIETFKSSNLQQKRDRHKPSTFHKEHDGGWFFEEYEPIIGDDGVLHFSASFGTECFGASEIPPELSDYVALLEGEARRQFKRPVLQFNRTGLRLKSFAEKFPHADHIYVLRSLDDQWGSYIRFLSDGRRGFLRSMLSCLGRGRDGDRLKPLQKLLPLIQAGTDQNLHPIYDSFFDTYTIEELYIAFYYKWLIAALDAIQGGLLIVPISDIADRPSEQAFLDAQLVKKGIAINWGQLKNDQYTLDKDSEERMARYRSVVNGVVREEYGDGIIDALERYGNDFLLSELKDNAKPDPSVQAFVDFSVSPEALQMRAAVFPQVKTLRETERRNRAVSDVLNQPHQLPVLPLSNAEFLPSDDWFTGMLRFALGWSTPEVDHVWSTIKESSLMFRIPQIARRLHVRLDMGVSKSLCDQSSTYTIKANGVIVARGQVTDLADLGFVDLVLDGSILARGRNGAVVFTFASDKVAEPVEGDVRRLFFVLFKTTFRLEVPSNVPASEVPAPSVSEKVFG